MFRTVLIEFCSPLKSAIVLFKDKLVPSTHDSGVSLISLKTEIEFDKS